MKLPPYTGQEKWEVWHNRFEAVAVLWGWNKHDKLANFSTLSPVSCFLLLNWSLYVIVVSITPILLFNSLITFQ
jgi:hypothetical protein